MTQTLAAGLLDSPPEEAFDRLTRLASRLLGAPVALVTLLGGDRVFFKSAIGLPEPWATRRSTPLSHSFCRHVVDTGAPLVVEDARRHPLVRGNPAVRELRWIAYAGVPLTVEGGETVGALCVVDHLPRIWSPRDVALLADLAASVVTELELRHPRRRLQRPADGPPAQEPVPDPTSPVFDVSALPMGLVQPDGRWLRVNPALAAMVGATPEALAGCPAEMLTHPADRAADQEALRLMRAGEVPSYRSEKRLLREGDEPVWVIATVTALSGGLSHVAFQDITERRLAEQDLRNREERYRLAAEAAQDALWDWDLLTDRIVWTESANGKFGYHRSGRTASAAWWYERLHADDRERVVSGIQAAIADGAASWSDQYRFRRADGRYAQLLDRATIVRDEAGDAVRMVGAVSDRSEELRAELVASGQSQLLEQIAAGLDLGAVLERIVRFTEAYGGDLTAAILVVATDTRELRLAAGPSLPPALREALAAVPLEPGAGLGPLAAVRRAPVVFPDLAAESPGVWSELLREAGVAAAWALPLFAADGSLIGTFQIHHPTPHQPDEADRRLVELAGRLAEIAIARDRSQDALARGTLLLEQVLDNLPVGVWVLDRDARIMFGNPAGRAIWGGPRYLGLEASEAYRGWWADSGEPVAPGEWAATRAILKGETSLNEAVNIETFDGAQKTILNSAVPLRSLSGEILGAILVSQDITDQRAAETALRRSEEQLRHAQKVEAVGQLAGGIAHDFNNLLTGILSYSELMLHDLRESDPMRGDLEQIRHAAQRAAALTRQLLAYSRRQVLQPRVLSLNSTVGEVDAMLRRLLGPEVSIEAELDPGLWYVLADPGQLEQVLVNLVVNARDAMPNGGVVTVTTANRQLHASDDARGNGVRAGGYVTLSVRDTGVGMDVPTQARIFDPFFTTKETGKGTGLGLSTVYGIVEQSGGHITVESAPGRGATFTIFLPRHEPSQSVTAAGHVDRRGLPTGTETLLLVEDEAAVRTSARRLLERHGYAVVEARHGRDALRILEEGERRIDLVITDLIMPEMGGREMVERVRTRYPAMKVLFMSGYSELAVTSGGTMPPGTGFVEKPFTVEQLIRRTREILDGQA